MMVVSNLPAQGNSLRICVVQPTDHFFGEEIKGTDAWKLAPEIAKHTLKNGKPIVAIAVTGRSREEADVAAARQDCRYIVYLWRYEGASAASDAEPGLTTPSDGILPVHDADGIQYELSRFEVHKVLLRGFAPPITHYGKGAYIFSPFPLFANQILKKLNKLER